MLGVFLEYLAASPELTSNLSSLKQVFTSGEALLPEHVSTFKLLLPQVKLMNLYGPTEASIDVSYYDCIENNQRITIPIGKPIDNTQLYILDNYHQLLPYGSIGEICIGGVGLARGYLNREELTKEKFIDNPYKPGERIYRTGDLGRWNEDQNLEYLGRIDDQVKIRGYRIELGEIESVLSQHEQVTAVVVVAKAISGEEKELIAYTTGEAEAITLKAYLKEKLPSYMVPNQIISLKEMPCNPSGKVNRHALRQILEYRNI
jgi:non-ribosomal peptide synthetase component F